MPTSEFDPGEGDGIHWLDVDEDISTSLLRARKARFELTKKGRDLAAPGRAGELFALLFEACATRGPRVPGGHFSTAGFVRLPAE